MDRGGLSSSESVSDHLNLGCRVEQEASVRLVANPGPTGTRRKPAYGDAAVADRRWPIVTGLTGDSLSLGNSVFRFFPESAGGVVVREGWTID